MMDLGHASSAPSMPWQHASPPQQPLPLCKPPHPSSTVQGGSRPLSLPTLLRTDRDHALPSDLSVQELISSVKRSRREKEPDLAMSLHIDMCIRGLDTHPAICNYLIPLLVECGSLPHAYRTFLKSYQRAEHSWTSLIQGYVEIGCFEKALHLFQSMSLACISPTKYTFQAMVKCFTRMNCLAEGQEIHCEIIKEELEKDPFIGSSLIDLYAKNGLFLEALELIDDLALRNVVSWNALILGYAEHGMYKEILECLASMRSQGFSPDVISFSGCLKGSNDIVEAHKIHMEIIKCGSESDMLCRNSLLDVYGRLNCFAEALNLFDELSNRDLITWNVLMGGYIHHGLDQEVIVCWEKLCSETISPNAPTFAFSLKACGSIGNPDKGQEIYVKVVKEGYENNVFVASSVVDMYAKCGWLTEAQASFDKLSARNVVSWGALISGYVEWGFGKEALDRWKRMTEIDDVAPNDIVYACILKACAMEGDLCNGREIHMEVLKTGYDSHISVSNSIVYMYAKCGAFEESISVFSWIRHRDVISWNVLISASAENGFHNDVLNSVEVMHSGGIFPNDITFVYLLESCRKLGSKARLQQIHMEIAKEGFERETRAAGALLEAYAAMGLLQEAQDIFEEIPERDVICWNAIISGYVEHGHGDEALHLIWRMEIECKPLDDIILVCGLKACAIIGALYNGRLFHSWLIRQGYDGNLAVQNSLVVMYAKCGSMLESIYTFDKLQIRSVMAWNALMTGYACKGESEPVFSIMEMIGEEGAVPDGVTLLNALSVCNHNGLVDEGFKCFELFGMYGITPRIEHYNSMLDLLGRCGKLSEAFAMIEEMPFQVTQAIWNTVLRACQKWGDVHTGLQLFKPATNA